MQAQTSYRHRTRTAPRGAALPLRETTVKLLPSVLFLSPQTTALSAQTGPQPKPRPRTAVPARPRHPPPLHHPPNPPPPPQGLPPASPHPSAHRHHGDQQPLSAAAAASPSQDPRAPRQADGRAGVGGGGTPRPAAGCPGEGSDGAGRYPLPPRPSPGEASGGGGRRGRRPPFPPTSFPRGKASAQSRGWRKSRGCSHRGETPAAPCPALPVPPAARQNPLAALPLPRSSPRSTPSSPRRRRLGHRWTWARPRPPQPPRRDGGKGRRRGAPPFPLRCNRLLPHSSTAPPFPAPAHAPRGRRPPRRLRRRIECPCHAPPLPGHARRGRPAEAVGAAWCVFGHPAHLQPRTRPGPEPGTALPPQHGPPPPRAVRQLQARANGRVPPPEGRKPGLEGRKRGCRGRGRAGKSWAEAPQTRSVGAGSGPRWGLQCAGQEKLGLFWSGLTAKRGARQGGWGPARQVTTGPAGSCAGEGRLTLPNLPLSRGSAVPAARSEELLI